MGMYSEYYNFNEILTLNDSLSFYDYDHLNQNGVELFNKKLIELLDENTGLMQNTGFKNSPKEE